MIRSFAVAFLLWLSGCRSNWADLLFRVYSQIELIFAEFDRNFCREILNSGCILRQIQRG
jgi:hypothetical protein